MLASSVAPHYVGHRQRQKDKFLKNTPASFSDYELLELLLFFSVPRKDVKPVAKEMLAIYGSLSNLLNSTEEGILQVKGTNRNIFLSLQIVRELINRVLSAQVMQQHVISSWSALLEYLTFNMASLKLEQFRVLFLNKKNALVADEVMAMGTVDQTPIYPREIIKRALFHEASAIILVHNHPSGNTKPSNADIELTKQIANSCKAVNVVVHDHIIIGAGGYYSFKSNLLL